MTVEGGTPISIHAPTWGATFPRLDTNPMTGFQSTHPRGVRHNSSHYIKPQVSFQSTHPRGVRPAPGVIDARHTYFNPRTHVGCDKEMARRLGAGSVFQSTHPRGVRLACGCCLFPTSTDFNPRTHVGCDVPQGCDGRNTGISIHAPTWGATGVTES